MAVQAAADAASVFASRAASLYSGKRMLSRGGAAAERALLAKMVASDVVQADAEIVDTVLELLGPDCGELRARLRTLPEEPPRSPAEVDAIMLVQVRMSKARLGLRRPVGTENTQFQGVCLGGSLCSVDCDLVLRPQGCVEHPINPSSSAELLFLDSNEGNKALEEMRTGHGSHPSERAVLDDRLALLFGIHDLNADGVLDEAEFVQLSVHVALRNYGHNSDCAMLRRRYQDTFRQGLDAEARSVGSAAFREYMLQSLARVDSRTDAQIEIVEQLIAEARLAKANLQAELHDSEEDKTACQRGPSGRGESNPHVAHQPGILPEIVYPGLSARLYPSGAGMD